MYLPTICASSMSILESTPSSSTGVPRSVFFTGTQPFSISRSPTCLRDPGLKGIYFTLVFICTLVGGNTFCISSFICTSSSLSSATSMQAFSWSRAKPLSSCSLSIMRMRCSSLMESPLNLCSSLISTLYNLQVSLMSCIQYSPISSVYPWEKREGSNSTFGKESFLPHASRE